MDASTNVQHRLVLDPAADLWAAGECSCDWCAQELFGALKGAIEELADARGLEVQVVRGPSPELCPEDDGEGCAVCNDLWQAAHDRVRGML